jgi:hypothetical protein
MISGFGRGVNEVFFLLECHAACVGSLLLMFLDSLLVPFSKSKPQHVRNEKISTFIPFELQCGAAPCYRTMDALIH